jgi:hypothetical protein
VHAAVFAGVFRLSAAVGQLIVRRKSVLQLDSWEVRWYEAVMSAQCVSDESGRRTAVLLPVEEYARLLEDLEDLAAIAERRDEPTISHEELVSGLKRDGLLPA